MGSIMAAGILDAGGSGGVGGCGHQGVVGLDVGISGGCS
jgi:hypothetical protein